MLERMLELKKMLSVTLLKTAKMHLLKRFRKMRKSVLNVILRKTNLGKSIVGQINIKLIRNKLDLLMAAAPGNIDILLIIETKIDDPTLPEN